jgi:hypothetical protein
MTVFLFRGRTSKWHCICEPARVVMAYLPLYPKFYVALPASLCFGSYPVKFAFVGRPHGEVFLF